MLEYGMNKRVFWFLFGLILAVQLIVRIVPPRDSNFYFTMDQASDAIYAREIFEGKQLVLVGPETGIAGLHAGPLWYYFISIGYFLFNGHPYGAVFMMILLNVGLAGFLMWYVGREVSKTAGIILGAALQVNWFFYDTSRWAFNPFPTIALSVIFVILLVRFLQGKKRAYFNALNPIILCFNTEVATASALFVFYFLFGFWAYFRKKIGLVQLVLTIMLLPAIGIVILLFQFAKKVYDTRVLAGQLVLGDGIFSGLNVLRMLEVFPELFARAIIPQNTIASVIVFALGFYFYLRSKQNGFTKSFLYLSLCLYLVSFVFFSTNRGWQDWHTYFLPVLLFIAFSLLLLSLRTKFAYVLFAIVLVFQSIVFQERYRQYLRPIDDFGILANQLAVLDWIYTHNEEDGFNAYTFTPHIYDYQNQYLFWWYGRQKYGFVPCEYSLYPGFMKYNYIPNSEDYSKPNLGCDKLRFLIVEMGNENIFAKQNPAYGKWREQVKFERGEKVDEAKVGRFKVEKWWIRPKT